MSAFQEEVLLGQQPIGVPAGLTYPAAPLPAPTSMALRNAVQQVGRWL